LLESVKVFAILARNGFHEVGLQLTFALSNKKYGNLTFFCIRFIVYISLIGGKLEKSRIVWTDYLVYRATLRGYDLEKIEKILRYSDERYYDVATNRLIVIGKHNDLIVMIPYERNEETLTPITIHVITRKQVNYRLKSGRFVYE
jgi:hypothetical protein